MRVLLVLLLAAITIAAEPPPSRLTPQNVGGLVQAWKLIRAKLTGAPAWAR